MNLNKVIQLAAFALLPAACSELSDKNSNESDKKVLRYNESAGISFLDPAFAARFEDGWAVSQLFNGLVQFNKNLEIVPCIARAFEVSENGLEYTFFLRKDVFFHDDDAFENGKGRKVVASDFVNSFFRLCDPETASPGQFIFQQINADKKETVNGFQALNDSTLKIFLKKPQSDFLFKLTLPFCSVVPHEAIDSYGEDFRKHPVGTGPFKFRLWQDDVKLVLVKNNHYFEKDDAGVALPYVDAITVSFIREKNVEVGEFLKGRLDFISGFHPSIQINILDQHGKLKPNLRDKFTLLRSPWLKTDYIGVMVDEKKAVTENSILRIREIRKAINYAIDREGLVRYFRSGIGIPASKGFIPSGMPGFESISIDGYTYDIEKAKELLFEAGLNLSKSEKEITLIAQKEYKELCEYLKKELEEIGLNMKIEIVPASVLRQRIALYQSNFFRKSWTGDYPDAMNFLQLFYSGNKSPKGPNYTQFSNSRFDFLFEEAMSQTEKVKRNELFKQMQEVLMDEAPVIPLFYDESIRVCSKRVQGLDANAMNNLDLKRVKINESKSSE